MTALTLAVSAPDVGDEALQRLTREMCLSIRRDTEIDAVVPEGRAVSGRRGEPITLGTIALAVLTSGVATALVRVLKTYFERRPSLQLEFRRADGSAVQLKAEHLASSEIQKTVESIEQLVGDTR